MNCPFCHQDETRVIDTRHVVESNVIRRRRECDHCRKRFTTLEKAELAMPLMIKSDGRRVKFEEEKLRKGVLRAVEKRPISMEDIERLLDKLKNKLLESGKREVSTQTIGEWVMVLLRELDPVAYVRFASVYRRFEDLDAFKEEIDEIEKNKKAD